MLFINISAARLGYNYVTGGRDKTKSYIVMCTNKLFKKYIIKLSVSVTTMMYFVCERQRTNYF